MTPAWSTACLDWRERIVAGRSLVPFEPLFPAEAEAALEVFRNLRLVDVSGGPTMAEANDEWVFDLPRALFGSYDAASGRRLIRYIFELISKKNSKSTRAAGVMLTALIRNWRDSGEFYIIAPRREAADNAFVPARDMVYADPELRRFLHVREAERTIIHLKTRAFLKVVAADSKVVAGKKTIGVMFDELHEFMGISGAESILREATGGLASRPEGFVIYLSTQSSKIPDGVFADKLKEFRAIRDGEIVDPESLPILREFPPAMLKSGAYKRPENWRITNPGLGRSVDPTFIASQMAKAERAGEAAVIDFEAKHLNVQVGVARGQSSWAGARWWKRRADPTLTLDTLIARCDLLVLGVDGGGLDDLLGACVLGREKLTGRWLAWVHAWAHRVVLKRRQQIAPRLLDLAAAGDLSLFGSEDEAENFVDVEIPPEEVADAAKALFGAEDLQGLLALAVKLDATGCLAAVAVDPAGVGLILDALAKKDIGGPGDSTGKDRIAGVTQGWKLMGSIKTVERYLRDGVLDHADQPIMDWCVGNARAEPKGNAILITKQASGIAKVDPLFALLDAAAILQTNPDPPNSSVYSAERGLVVFG